MTQPTSPPRALNQTVVLPRRSSQWKGKRLSLSVGEADPSNGPTAWRFVISRRIEKQAVRRNRWKRRIREVLRRHKEAIRPGHQGVFRVMVGGQEPSSTALQEEILELLRRSGLFSAPKGGR